MERQRAEKLKRRWEEEVCLRLGETKRAEEAERRITELEAKLASRYESYQCVPQPIR